MSIANRTLNRSPASLSASQSRVLAAIQSWVASRRHLHLQAVARNQDQTAISSRNVRAVTLGQVAIQSQAVNQSHDSASSLNRKWAVIPSRNARTVIQNLRARPVRQVDHRAASPLDHRAAPTGPVPDREVARKRPSQNAHRAWRAPAAATNAEKVVCQPVRVKVQRALAASVKISTHATSRTMKPSQVEKILVERNPKTTAVGRCSCRRLLPSRRKDWLPNFVHVLWSRSQGLLAFSTQKTRQFGTMISVRRPAKTTSK